MKMWRITQNDELNDDKLDEFYRTRLQCMLYVSGVQTAARGPNAARAQKLCGPQRVAVFE